MATITLGGNEIHTSGELPKVRSKAPASTLTTRDLKDVGIDSFLGQSLILNVFPSVDTGVCATSVRTFNKKAASLEGVKVLNVAADLPFALKRFCGSEGIDNADAASSFRSSFATDYGLEIVDGPMRGLCSRAVLVLNAEGKVIYTEQVPEIAQEPDYDAALAALG